MKFAMVLMSVVSICSTVAMAKSPSPQSTCLVKETGEVIARADFFNKVSNAARTEGCVRGKLAGVSESGRMYVMYDGQPHKVGDNLSNKEASQLARQYGYNSCQTYTCDELGASAGDNQGGHHSKQDNQDQGTVIIVTPSGDGSGDGY